MRLLTLPGAQFTQVAYLGDRLLAAVDWQEARRAVRLWNLDGSGPQTVPWQQADVIDALFIPGGERFLRVQGLWPEGEVVPPVPQGHAIRRRLTLGLLDLPVAYGPDGASAIHFRAGDGPGYLFRITDSHGEVITPHDPGNSSSGAVAFSPDGGLAALGGQEYFYVWDLKRRNEVACLPHRDRVLRLAFSPDGRLAVTAGRTVFVWQVSTGGASGIEGWHAHKLRSFRKYAYALAVSPDGRLLAAGSDDGTVRLWELASSRELAHHDWDAGKVRAVAFSPDGSTAAAAAERGLVVWDLE